MLHQLLLAAALAATLAASAGRLAAQRSGARWPTPDYIVTGGKVFTADSTRPWADAFAVRGERIVAVGSNAEIEALSGPRTRRIAVQGRVVIPGINDAHDHLGEGEFGEKFATSDLSPTGSSLPGPSFAEVRDSLRTIAERTPRGRWLQAYLGLRMLTDTAARRGTLDAIAPDHPVLLRAWWGHGFLLNTAGLRALGIAENATDPLGGLYVRDATGRLTGEITEYAAWGPLRRIATARPDRVNVRRLQESVNARLAFGVTSVQDMASAWDAASTMRLLRRAQLPVRVRVIRWPMTTASGRSLGEWNSLTASNAPRLRVSGIKYVLDGTPLEQGAFNTRAYEGRPTWFGAMNFPLDTVRAMLRESLAADGANGQVMFHVVGDSTMALLLGAMQALAPDSVWRARRVRVEHASRLGGAKLATAARLGIVIAQPRSSASFRSWLAAGIVLGYGSDGQPNPFVDFAGAITMPDRPNEAITREQAAMMLTRGSAWAEWAERDKGSIAPGMLADFAVLSQDIFEVPAAQVPSTRSVLTAVGGRVVYDARTVRLTP